MIRRNLLTCSLFFFFSAVLSMTAFSQKDSLSKTTTVNPASKPIDSNILVVVNGKVAGTIRELRKDINNLFPADRIESINVLRGDQAAGKYGEKGKAGVFEFKLKNTEVPEEKTEASSRTDEDSPDATENNKSF